MRISQIAVQIAAVRKWMVRVDDANKLVRQKRGDLEIFGAVERRDGKIVITRGNGLKSIVAPWGHFNAAFGELLGEFARRRLVK